MAFAALRSAIPSPTTRFVRPTMSASQHLCQPSQTRHVSFSSYLVSPKELNTALQKNPPTKISTSPRVVPICAAWFMPNDPEGRKGLDIFRKHRIPQARFFDLDGVKDRDSPYPHMLPTAETFAEAMSELGIRRDDEIVVYDTEELGIFSAPRVGWTLRVFGHPKVHILNNYRLWVREGYPTETGEPLQPDRTSYPVPTYDSKLVIPYLELKEVAKEHRKEGSKEVEILDARSYGRWAGTDPEPRPGLPSGHIPGSTSMPFQELLDPETKTYLPGPELRKIFEKREIDPTKSIISSCGTGVTATIIETALGEAEYGDACLRRVYDGSWTEWAQRVKPADGLIRKA
ncbi:Rhodanese-like protein [Aspergillus taichungensis]|uniref:Rhodanese-like protein n=1 Tax=Aspergillus taichungensis TaxID=482145 RepID=A0A2J5I6K9_9EURO|nr:Rhodanese-like protein [Aspergillus taichungensis]